MAERALYKNSLCSKKPTQVGRQAVIVFTDTKKVIASEEGNYTKTHRSKF
jgi:imidazole glycerol phosphate synthase subunit HisF